MKITEEKRNDADGRTMNDECGMMNRGSASIFNKYHRILSNIGSELGLEGCLSKTNNN